MFNKNKKVFTKILVFLTIFLAFSAIGLANTQGGSGGTGILDGLIDFLKKLVVDYRAVLMIVGVLGIIGSIIGEMFMPDMGRTLKIAVGSFVAFAIGVGAELAVNQLGGAMIDPELISQNTQYLKLVIGV